MPIEAVLFAMLIAMAVAVAKLRDLYACAMLTGIFSLLSACLFTLMDAVDVAYTEAAVGAGISTVLFLGTLSLTDRAERPQKFRALPVLVVVVTGAALMYGTLDMPAYGDPEAPAHQHVGPDYMAQAPVEFEGIPNVVTPILGSWRGYDTFGETTVIFTAAVGVMLLLGRRRKKKKE